MRTGTKKMSALCFGTQRANCSSNWICREGDQTNLLKLLNIYRSHRLQRHRLRFLFSRNNREDRGWPGPVNRNNIFLFFLFPCVGIMGWERFQNANRVLNDTKGRVIFLFLFRKTKTQRTFFLFVVTFETLYLENFLELGICSNERNVLQHREI